ncbi:related to homeoprotein [Cephalotrichum gorgonifer]|uniref:Related to homeoprotein n=1 Tax=Cephalotrichum gorgonifer TaxID=2041049 RepID=A0AAE8SZJ0_9PEZI|nr:related to homeoprotein [Cephalotrichum gorgonifer]
MDPIMESQAIASASPEAPTPTSMSLSPGSGLTPIKTESSNDARLQAGQGQTPSRRPPRKSTLTQQQKNQKRQRATQDQLTTLELEFSKNPTPTAEVRDRIAEEINMTQRSVQIWFQNRRAKIKLMAKRHLENGEDLDSIPESMRQYLAMQAIESGKGLAGGLLGRSGLLPYGNNGMLMGGDPTGQSKVLIQHLTCRALSIGTWTRVGQNMMDLIVFYSPDKCTMTYYINNEQAGYKIEYAFAYIKNIYLENNEGDPAKPAGIVIELNRPPHFFMDSSANAQGFYQVADFTEDMQASRCLVHRLGGSPKVLSGQLAKLVSLESFMNRHLQQPHQPPMFETHALSASAPVSPTARPSSQPNFAQPHVGMYQESWGAPPSIQPGMRGPGHKRQRSRSVPMPVDFSMFQAPMPSFYIQQPGETSHHQSNPQIFAPVPQQPSAPGSNLRIDTQAGFGLDMRQYPMSATTASPSEFSSPNYFAQGSESTPLPVNTPYSATFLSPMPNPANLVAPSVSPLSFNGPTEPSIVEQSPPLSMMGRPASAGGYQMNEGSCAVSDDGSGLNDMYSKHNLNLPMHPHSPVHFTEHQQTEADMSQLVQFDSADHSSLSPEAMPQGTHQQQVMHPATPQAAQ